MLYVFLFPNYLDVSVMEIFWPMQLSVYQGISASNVFGVVCLYNDEEFFILFVHLFLFKLYLIDFSWDLNCITLLCALTEDAVWRDQSSTYQIQLRKNGQTTLTNHRLAKILQSFTTSALIVCDPARWTEF